MIQAILNFFGIGKKAEPVVDEVITRPVQAAPDAQVIQPVTTRQPQISLKKAQTRKLRTNPKMYYRRGGSYYGVEDDCLIEDLVLLYVLSELFTDSDLQTFEEMEQFAAEEAAAQADAEPVEDLLDVDVSETPVVEAPSYTPPEPSYTPEPEPVKQDSYSSGDSYGSGSSDYDSGGSDSGGSDD